MTPVEIKLYQTASEPTMVEKTLVEQATVTGYFKQVQDITAPVIDLAFNDRDTFNLYFNSNYAYIALFNRYYFISRKEVGMNNILSIYMDEDALMSFKEEIYNLTPLVTRQATDYDSMLIDGSIPFKSTPNVSITKYKLFDTRKETYSLEFKPYGFLLKTFVTSNFSNIIDTPSSGLVSYTPAYLMNPFVFNSAMEKILDPTFIDSITTSLFQESSEYITDAFLVPFDYSSSYILSNIGGQTNQIFIGDKSIVLTSDDPDIEYKVQPINPKTRFLLKVEPINIEVKHNKFYDNFNKYEIFIPFIGWRELNADILINATPSNSLTLTLYCYFYIDPSTMNFEFIISKSEIEVNVYQIDYKYWEISKYEQQDFLFTYSGNMRNEAPLGTTNKNSVNRNLLLGGVKALSSVALAPFTGGASLMGLTGGIGISQQTAKLQKKTTDRRLRVGSDAYNSRMSAYKESLAGDITAMGISTAANTLNEVLSTFQRSSYVSEPSETNVLNTFTGSSILFRSTIEVPNIPGNYYELYGGVCNLTVLLSTLKGKGFTKCANVHMTGFVNATSSEINEIESLLLSGVIL